MKDYTINLIAFLIIIGLIFGILFCLALVLDHVEHELDARCRAAGFNYTGKTQKQDIFICVADNETNMIHPKYLREIT